MILQQPKSQVMVVLASGLTLAFETDVDAISSGKPGREKCGFVLAEYWGKSSFALVVDLEERKLVKQQKSD